MKLRRLRWRSYRKTGGPLGIGLRCKDYFAGCIVCESYRYFDEHGRFPTFDEVRPISDAILGNLTSLEETQVPGCTTQGG